MRWKLALCEILFWLFFLPFCIYPAEVTVDYLGVIQQVEIPASNIKVYIFDTVGFGNGIVCNGAAVLELKKSHCVIVMENDVVKDRQFFDNYKNAEKKFADYLKTKNKKKKFNKNKSILENAFKPDLENL